MCEKFNRLFWRVSSYTYAYVYASSAGHFLMRAELCARAFCLFFVFAKCVIEVIYILISYFYYTEILQNKNHRVFLFVMNVIEFFVIELKEVQNRVIFRRKKKGFFYFNFSTKVKVWRICVCALCLWWIAEMPWLYVYNWMWVFQRFFKKLHSNGIFITRAL